jgi:protein-disulfide isomerase
MPLKHLLPPALLLLTLAACVPQQTPSSSSVPAPRSSSSSSETVPDVRTLIASGSTLDLGKENAPLTLLVFTNQSCEYCRDFQQTIVPRLKADFVDKGTVLLRVSILPIHKYPLSLREASALFCAARQGKGWEMHDALFAVPAHTEAALLAQAAVLKLDLPRFQSCLGRPEAAAYAQEEARLADKLHVTLVPTLFLNDEKLVGLPTYADIKGWIEQKTR